MREKTYYAIIAVGGLTIVLVLAIWLWPERGLESPEVLADRLLSSQSPEEQIEAARGLIQHGVKARPQVDRVLAEYRGTNPEVTVMIIEAAQSATCWQSVPRLIELMEDPDSRVRGRAGAAVSRIMGADYGFRADDPPQKRAEKLVLIKTIYGNMKSDLEEFYTGRK